MANAYSDIGLIGLALNFFSALACSDSHRSARVPANLLPAQGDYFGAHPCERTDKPRGKFFHLDGPEPTRPGLGSGGFFREDPILWI